MRMLVLGAGLQGSACAYDLLRQPEVERVTLADLHPDRLPPFLKRVKSRRLKLRALNAGNAAALRATLKGHDAVMCALPYYFNYAVSRAAVRAGVHHTDLGGNTAIVMKQKRLDRDARKRGVSVIPDCGLAPGMVNIIAAEGIRRVGQAETVKIYVGGLFGHAIGYSFTTLGRAGLERYRNDDLTGKRNELTSVIDQLRGKRQTGGKGTSRDEAAPGRGWHSVSPSRR